MRMFSPDLDQVRKTTSEDVFSHLKGEIVAMRLIPGTKLSEAEVAKHYGVSRQPVREAFIRLDGEKLVEIRPQRATVVRRISRGDVIESRFIRTSVELEIASRACERYDGALDDKLTENLSQQADAASAGDANKFNKLDYDLHHMLCIAGDAEFAYRSIAENKTCVDRLCMLSLLDKDELEGVLADHVALVAHLQTRDTDAMLDMTRRHLSRLNETLDAAEKQFPDYFEQ